MTTEQNIRYRNILIEPINECAHYSPKFGHGQMVDFRLQNSKHYTEQIRFINGLDWTILLCILPIKQLVA